jgi:hypothetical protein
MKSIMLTAAVFLTLTGCAAATEEDDVEPASSEEAISGRPLAPSITKKKAEVYLYFAAGGSVGGSPHVVGPLDVVAAGSSAPRTNLSVRRPTQIRHDRVRLAYPMVGAPPITVAAHVAFNDSNQFTSVPVENEVTTPFFLPKGAKSMTVYFEGMAPVPPRDPAMVEGASFRRESIGGLPIYGKVIKHGDGTLWLHTWDSDEGRNFRFAVLP